MKVAFFVYPSAFQNKGGGEILLEKIEEYLLKRGVQVKRFDMWNDRIEDFDILHVFGSVKDCLPMMRVASSRGVKVVLESIFWSDIRRAALEQGTAKEKLNKMVRHAVKVLFPFFPSSRKKMFEISDMIIPNSVNEATQISRLFKVPMEKMFVVRNGVDVKFAHARPDRFIAEYGIRDFVLSVGRIEPRKNQLNLIRAMNGVDKDLVLIGEAVSGYEWYFDRCKKAAGPNVRFLGKMPHGSDLLMSAFAACDTFVLPAWFETPGLAALEAGLAGAKVVATVGGSTREYFFDEVLYIEPGSPADIRKKIKMSISAPGATGLKELILANYTWDKIADKTIEGYGKVMKK
jgi:glycosyltransferase involved in cell wall biosynthesis